MKGSLDNVNNTLGEMKYTIDSLFLINAMKESSYQLDDKNSIDNLISNRCNLILKELIEKDKKNNNKNEIDIKKENNIINEKSIQIKQSQKQNVDSNNCDNKNEKSFNGANSNLSMNQKNKNKKRFSFSKKTSKSKSKDNISKDNLSGKLSSSKEESINTHNEPTIKNNITNKISGREGNKGRMKINFKRNGRKEKKIYDTGKYIFKKPNKLSQKSNQKIYS